MAKYFLIPGNKGEDCFGNGFHTTKYDTLIECRCDNCKYLICCLGEECKSCNIKPCYRKRALKYVKRKRRQERFLRFISKSFYASILAPYPEAFIEEFLND